MAAYTGKRFFARFSRQFALALTLALTGTIGAVGIKIDNDILRVDQDQQQSATMVVKEIDKTLLQPTGKSEMSEGDLGRQLLEELGKHPSAMDEIVHILEAKTAELDATLSSDVECLATRRLLDQEILRLRSNASIDNLNRIIETHAFLNKHCRGQNQTQK